MDIFTVGIGDAFSTRHWGTSFLVRHNDFVLAVDSPDAYLRALHEHAWPHKGRPFTPDHIDAFFLTHLHGDHVNGLEMLLAWRSVVTQKLLDIYTTPPVAEKLWDQRLAASLGTIWDGHTHHTKTLADYANLHIIDWNLPTHIGPLTLTTRQTIHHLPTAALRIQADHKTWAYSCDTAYDPELIEWLSSADLIFHETNFGPAHTPIEALEALPEPIRQKLVVVHIPDTLQPTPKLQIGIQGKTYTL